MSSFVIFNKPSETATLYRRLPPIGALRYAREMYTNPENVNATFYAEGKRHYSEAQIMELGAFIALHYGMHAWARTLDLRGGDST